MRYFHKTLFICVSHIKLWKLSKVLMVVSSALVMSITVQISCFRLSSVIKET